MTHSRAMVLAPIKPQPNDLPTRSPFPLDFSAVVVLKSTAFDRSKMALERSKCSEYRQTCTSCQDPSVRPTYAGTSHT
jgi:hypothetical protein